MPFKWYRNRYACFYCNDTFPDCKILKKHFKQHGDIDTSSYLKQNSSAHRIKWDVSEISCKLGPKTIHDFDQFVNHLRKLDMSFDRD